MIPTQVAMLCVTSLAVTVIAIIGIAAVLMVKWMYSEMANRQEHHDVVQLQLLDAWMVAQRQIYQVQGATPNCMKPDNDSEDTDEEGTRYVFPV